MTKDKSQVFTITDEVISAAMMAIESVEPTPQELEAGRLAKLVPVIRMALDRGDPEQAIRVRLKNAMPRLHYSKVDKLFDDAKSFNAEQATSENDV